MLQKLLDWHGSAFTADTTTNSTGTQSMKKIAVDGQFALGKLRGHVDPGYRRHERPADRS
jgi:hypothetical protein